MVDRSRIITLDPYFDGEGGQADRAMPQRNTGRPATPQSPHGYYPADVDRTASGIPLTGAMRPGPSGLRGVVIPRATMGGIPMGTHPHATADIEVVIDPHIEGQSSRVRLGDINAETVKAALAVAQEVTPEPTSIETMRLRGAATMHAIAAAAADQKQAQLPVAPQQPQLEQVYQSPTVAPQVQQPPQPYYQLPGTGTDGIAPAQQYTPPLPPVQEAPIPLPPAQGPPPQSKSTRRITPLAAFNQPPTEATREGNPREAALATSSSDVVAPAIEVIFEMGGYGTNRAYYHDVIVEEGFIILVYDNRYTGPRYFPPVSTEETPPPLALNISGTEEVYRVQTTGVQYAAAHLEHCVLMIEETGKLPPA